MLAYVDAEDLQRCLEFNWHFDGRYATKNGPGRGKKQYLHHFILGINSQGKKIQVDHLNENKLDCRKNNLVVISEAEHKRKHVSRLHDWQRETGYYKKLWKVRRKRYGKSGRRELQNSA